MDIEAFILIGGRSSRLGRDKAFVEVGGETLARRSLKTLTESGVVSKTTFVAGSEMQFAIEAVSLGVLFICDLVPDRGPLGGLHAALSYATTRWIFVLACDYPFVTPEMVKLLSDQISDANGAVVPVQPDGRLQPLCAFYEVRRAAAVVTDVIERPRVSPPLVDIVSELEPYIVGYDEYAMLPGSSEFFLNINTPDDLDRAQEMQITIDGKR